MSEKKMRLPTVPDRYRKMKSMPDDPPYSCAYGHETEEAGCFVIMYPIPLAQAMPFENPESVIDGIHEALGDDQGLVAVDSGKTMAGLDFIYSIVKTLKEPSGVQYCLTMHLCYGQYAVQVQGFFDELGVTGMRDAMIFTQAQSEGKVEATEDGIKGWNADPYDPDYSHGCLMNLSEQQEYDRWFPQHPLSEARQLIEDLTSIN